MKQFKAGDRVIVIKDGKDGHNRCTFKKGEFATIINDTSTSNENKMKFDDGRIANYYYHDMCEIELYKGVESPVEKVTGTGWGFE